MLEGLGHRPTQMSVDSLKMLWRSMIRFVHAWLVHPFLSLHTLPTLPLCQLRSAQPLSEYTDKAETSDRSSENAIPVPSDYLQGRVLFWLKGACGAGGVRSTDTRGGGSWKGKFTWIYSFGLLVWVLSHHAFSAFSASRATARERV